MEAIDLIDWITEGEKRFGKDKRRWAFKCPACGHISTVQEFIDLGVDGTNAFVECIGHRNGKGEDGLRGHDKGYGCNWAAYGLFGTLKGGRVVITIEGEKVSVFDFADVEEEETCKK